MLFGTAFLLNDFIKNEWFLLFTLQYIRICVKMMLESGTLPKKWYFRFLKLEVIQK